MRYVALLATVWLASVPARSGAQTRLDVDPVYQQTPVWCWAAVGEMVFEYYGVGNINPAGNFQCGIIALLHPACNQNCANCIVPAGSLTTMNNMLTQYPRVASNVTGTRTGIATKTSYGPLSLSSLRREIDGGRPVVAGISPSGYRFSGVSEHVALIIGYEDDDLIVNDPFPFDLAFAGNPYEAAGGEEIEAGQYRISRDAFVGRLRWRETIYGITCSGRDCNSASTDGSSEPDDEDDDEEDRTSRSRGMGRSCQTPVGRCGPFYNQPALPLGADCFCATFAGPVSGRVVRP